MSNSANIQTMESTININTTPVSTSFENITIRAYQNPFDEAAVIVSSTILLPLMVLGIIANVITIITISTSPRLKTVFNHFILSLCVSDLISALISPLFIYRRTWGYNVWKLPSFFCKLYWATDMWTSYVTALHILLFAILRLISIKWPVSYGKIKMRHARIIIPSLWILAFLTGFIPFAWWFDSGIRKRNTDAIDARWPACTLIPEWEKEYSIYQSIAYPLFFYVPIIAVISLTILIGILLTRRQNERNEKLQKHIPSGTESKLKKSGRKERQAMIQLSMISASFMLGYIPFTAYEISSAHDTTNTDASERFFWRFGMIEYICLRFSETLNPFFYNIASPKMRAETKRVINAMFAAVCKCWCKTKSTKSPAVSSTSSAGGDMLPGVKTIASPSHINQALDMNGES